MIIKSKVSKSSIAPPFSKAAVDVRRRTMSLDGELHIDCAEELTNDGSAAADIWGINIYPDGHIDFISLINVRPAENNRTMDIQNQEVRDKIENIVEKLLL